MAGDQQQLLTIEDLSRRSRLSVSTLRRLARAGKIPFFQPSGKGGRLLFPEDAIERAVVGSLPSTPTPNGEPQKLAGPRPAWMRGPAATN